MDNIFATMLLQRHSLYFDMQHDHILNKLNFNLLTPGSGASAGKIFAACVIPFY